MMSRFKQRWKQRNKKKKLTQLAKLQKAEAELAYELQAAKTKQRIKEENMQIKVRRNQD